MKQILELPSVAKAARYDNMNVGISGEDPHPDPYVFGPPGSASGFVSQRTDPRIRIHTQIHTKMSRIRWIRCTGPL